MRSQNAKSGGWKRSLLTAAVLFFMLAQECAPAAIVDAKPNAAVYYSTYDSGMLQKCAIMAYAFDGLVGNPSSYSPPASLDAAQFKFVQINGTYDAVSQTRSYELYVSPQLSQCVRIELQICDGQWVSSVQELSGGSWVQSSRVAVSERYTHNFTKPSGEPISGGNSLSANATACQVPAGFSFATGTKMDGLVNRVQLCICQLQGAQVFRVSMKGGNASTSVATQKFVAFDAYSSGQSLHNGSVALQAVASSDPSEYYWKAYVVAGEANDGSSYSAPFSQAGAELVPSQYAWQAGQAKTIITYVKPNQSGIAAVEFEVPEGYSGAYATFQGPCSSHYISRPYNPYGVKDDGYAISQSSPLCSDAAGGSYDPQFASAIAYSAGGMQTANKRIMVVANVTQGSYAKMELTVTYSGGVALAADGINDFFVAQAAQFHCTSFPQISISASVAVSQQQYGSGAKAIFGFGGPERGIYAVVSNGKYSLLVAGSEYAGSVSPSQGFDSVEMLISGGYCTLYVNGTASASAQAYQNCSSGQITFCCASNGAQASMHLKCLIKGMSVRVSGMQCQGPSCWSPSVRDLAGSSSWSSWSLDSAAEYYEAAANVTANGTCWIGEFQVPDGYMGLDVWEYSGGSWVLKNGASGYTLTVPYFWNVTDKINGTAYSNASGIPKDWGSGGTMAPAPSYGSALRVQLRVDSATTAQLKVRVRYSTLPAIGFDGATDYIEVLNSTSINPPEITLYVKLRSVPAVWSVYIARSLWGTENPYLLGEGAISMVYAKVKTVGGGSSGYSSAFGTMQISEYALVYSSSSGLYLYRNASQVLNEPPSGAIDYSEAYSLRISTPADGNEFTGSVSAVKLFSDYHSGAEIGGLAEDTANLRLYINASSWNGTVFADLSGNGNHGTPYGNVQYKVYSASQGPIASLAFAGYTVQQGENVQLSWSGSVRYNSSCSMLAELSPSAQGMPPVQLSSSGISMAKRIDSGVPSIFAMQQKKLEFGNGTILGVPGFSPLLSGLSDLRNATLRLSIGKWAGANVTLNSSSGNYVEVRGAEDCYVVVVLNNRCMGHDYTMGGTYYFQAYPQAEIRSWSVYYMPGQQVGCRGVILVRAYSDEQGADFPFDFKQIFSVSSVVSYWGSTWWGPLAYVVLALLPLSYFIKSRGDVYGAGLVSIAVAMLGVAMSRELASTLMLVVAAVMAMLIYRLVWKSETEAQ